MLFFNSRLSSCLSLFSFLPVLPTVFAHNANSNSTGASNHTTVLILGAGTTGIIAARTLYEQGIDDFIVLESKANLGGRLMPQAFGSPGKQVVIELGPSWIQGTQQGNGPMNPIWELALKHNLTTTLNDWYGSVTFYDGTGFNDYTDVFNDAVDNFDRAMVVAGQRLLDGDVDMSLRAAYSLMGIAPTTPQEVASDYFQIDFSPSQTSWLASSWNNNFTYVPEYGGFSDVNQMSIDQRGYRYLLEAEAAEFLQPQQIMYNQTVNLIEYGDNGVTVHTGGMTFTADHVLCTFSVGVLQNTDVVFQPSFPDWKWDIINSIDMATYTKIFLQFNETFWFPTEMGLYAAQQRGRYAVWQSLDHVGFFPGSGIILVTVTGDWSLYVEQLTRDKLQSEVIEVLRVMYPNITVPEPEDFLMFSWSQDPLFRGSYSNWGPSYVLQHSENLKATLNNRLWFAGEATTVEYYGFIHGAYFEGQNTATAIAACVQGKGTCGFPYTTNPTNTQPYQEFLTRPIVSPISNSFPIGYLFQNSDL